VSKVLREDIPRADNGVVQNETFHRFYDPRYEALVVRILPGTHYVTQDKEEMLVTILGSCIAACVRDPVTGIGGLNHFMLPDSKIDRWQEISAAMRYGTYAMEVLINEVLATGCKRDRLEIKIFGGANIVMGRKSIGHLNTAFVERYMETEGLAVAAKDLGGNRPRRIHYFPATGKVFRRILDHPVDAKIFEQESKFRTRLANASVGGDVELFE